MQHGVLANNGRRYCKHFGRSKLQCLCNWVLSKFRHVCSKLVWSGLVDLQWRLLGAVPPMNYGERHHQHLHRKVCGTQPRLVQRCEDDQSGGNNRYISVDDGGCGSGWIHMSVSFLQQCTHGAGRCLRFVGVRVVCQQQQFWCLQRQSGGTPVERQHSLHRRPSG